MLGLILEDEAKGNNGPKFTTEQIIDECKTFFFAGHETTAGLLAWTMVLLAEHQEWQGRARQEVLEVCGGKEDLNSSSLSRLKLVKPISIFLSFLVLMKRFVYGFGQPGT